MKLSKRLSKWLESRPKRPKRTRKQSIFKMVSFLYFVGLFFLGVILILAGDSIIKAGLIQKGINFLLVGFIMVVASAAFSHTFDLLELQDRIKELEKKVKK